jgi:predicted aspartyl protease
MLRVGLLVLVTAVATSPGLHAGRPAVVPFEMAGRHIFIEARLAGEKLDFVFDTGASSAVLSQATAARIGIVPERVSTATGASGEMRVGFSEGNRLELGELALDDVELTLVPLEHLERGIGHEIDGILGYELLSRFVVTIDYGASRLVVHRRGSFRPGEGAVEHRFRMHLNIPDIEGTIRLADGGEVSGRFLVDTGAGTSLVLNTPFVDEHRLLTRVPNPYRRVTGSLTTDDTESFASRVAELRILGHRFTDPPVHLSRSDAGVEAMDEFAGILGNEILRRLEITYDYRNRRLWVSPGAGLDDPFRVDCSGMTLRRGEDMRSVVVRSIIAGSPAAEAGVSGGDELLAVDGEPVEGRALESVRAQLRRAGETVEVELRRGDDIGRYILILRELN